MTIEEDRKEEEEKGEEEDEEEWYDVKLQNVWGLVRQNTNVLLMWLSTLQSQFVVLLTYEFQVIKRFCTSEIAVAHYWY